MLKRHLNPFLLVSVVLILSLLAGLSVLYQGQLNNLVTDKKELSQELNQKNQQITQLKQQKSNLSTKLESTESDLQRYIELYKSEEKQRKSLQDRVEDLEQQVEELRVDQGLVEDLNTTIGLICIDNETQLSSYAAQRCRESGYQP